jgi:hypothetical protein
VAPTKGEVVLVLEESSLEALSRYGTRSGFGMLTSQDRPPLERLRAHFEFLSEDLLENGFVRGCLLGNLGAEVADHSEEIRTPAKRGFDGWATFRATRGARARRRRPQRSRGLLWPLTGQNARQAAHRGAGGERVQGRSERTA